MRNLCVIPRAAVLGLALLLGGSACGPALSEQPGHGVVLSRGIAARTVTLDHEDIPGLMKAMTMTFQVAPGVDLEAIEPGAEVDFRAKEEGGGYTVTEIDPR